MPASAKHRRTCRPGRVLLAIPEEDLVSYPLYMPDREPAGYWDRLQSAGPQPLIEPDALATESDWIAAGERVFLDSVVLKTFDSQVIAIARDQQAMASRGTGPLPDGTVNGMRWVPTERGVALGFTNCSACHLLYLPDNTIVAGSIVVRHTQQFSQWHRWGVVPRSARCPARRRLHWPVRLASKRTRPTGRHVDDRRVRQLAQRARGPEDPSGRGLPEAVTHR